MVRETRHLWVGNLPEHVREEKIVEHFKRYGRVESVKVLRKRGSEGGVAAFVDFVDIKSAQKAHNAVNKMGDRDLRTDYNEPGSVPSAVRGLDDSSPSSSHGREVAGFSRGTVGPVYGPPVSLHTREGRYERRLDGVNVEYLFAPTNRQGLLISHHLQPLIVVRLETKDENWDKRGEDDKRGKRRIILEPTKRSQRQKSRRPLSWIDEEHFCWI